MAHHRKYTEPTRTRTTTWSARDLDILDSHADHRTTTTDHLQQAVREYIERNGWADEQPTETTTSNTKQP